MVSRTSSGTSAGTSTECVPQRWVLVLVVVVLELLVFFLLLLLLSILLLSFFLLVLLLLLFFFFFFFFFMLFVFLLLFLLFVFLLLSLLSFLSLCVLRRVPPQNSTHQSGVLCERHKRLISSALPGGRQVKGLMIPMKIKVSPPDRSERPSSVNDHPPPRRP